MAGSNHPGRVGGERAARDSNMSGGGRNRDRGRDRSMHPGRVGGEQAARASNQMGGGRPSSRPGGDHPGRVGGEQAQGASSVNAPSVDRFKDARSALGGRIRDEADLENTDLDDFGNVLAGLAGFHELEPDFDINNTNYNADWGFDVLGALAGIGGMALGVPGLGTVVGGIEEAAGVRDDLSINIGPDPLGMGDDDVPLGYAGGDEPTDDGETTPGVDAVMGGGGGAPGIDGAVDDLLPERDVKKPPKPPKPKPPKPYSNVMLGDVVSVLDWLA